MTAFSSQSTILRSLLALSSTISPWQMVGIVVGAIFLQAGILYAGYRLVRYLFGMDDHVESHTTTISPAGRALLSTLMPNGSFRGRYQRLSDQSEHSSLLPQQGSVEMNSLASAQGGNPVVSSSFCESASGKSISLNNYTSQPGNESTSITVQGNVPYYMQPYYQYTSNNPDNEPVARVSASIRNKYRSPPTTTNQSTVTETQASKAVVPSAVVPTNSAPALAKPSKPVVSIHNKGNNKTELDDVSVASGKKSVTSRVGNQVRTNVKSGSGSTTPNNNTAQTETHVKTRYSQAFANGSALSNPTTSSGKAKQTPTSNNKVAATTVANGNKIISPLGDNSSIETSSTRNSDPQKQANRRSIGSMGSADSNRLSGDYSGRVPATVELLPATVNSAPNSGKKNHNSGTVVDWSAPSSARHRVINLTPEALKVAEQFQQMQQQQLTGQQQVPLSIKQEPVTAPPPLTCKSNDREEISNDEGEKSGSGGWFWSFFGKSSSEKPKNSTNIASSSKDPISPPSQASTPVANNNTRSLPTTPTVSVASGSDPLVSINLALPDGNTTTPTPLQPLLQTPLFPPHSFPQQQQQPMMFSPQQQFLSPLHQQFEVDPVIYASLTKEQKEQFHVQLQYEAQQQYYAAAAANGMMPRVMQPSPYHQPYVYFAQNPSVSSYSPACVFSSPTGVVGGGMSYMPMSMSPFGKLPAITTEAATSPSMPDAPIAILHARSLVSDNQSVVSGGHRSVHFPSTDDLLAAHAPAIVLSPESPVLANRSTDSAHSFFQKDQIPSIALMQTPPHLMGQPTLPLASHHYNPITNDYYYDSYDSPGPATHDTHSKSGKSGSGSSVNLSDIDSSHQSIGSRGSSPSRRPSSTMSKSPPRSRSSAPAASTGSSGSSVHSSYYRSNNLEYADHDGMIYEGGGHHLTDEERTVASSRAGGLSRQTTISAFRSDRGLRDETIINPNQMPSNPHNSHQKNNSNPSNGSSSNNNKAKIEKVIQKYIKQIDNFIRTRPNFYAPGYVYPIAKLFEQVPPPKSLISPITASSSTNLKDINGFIKFLKANDHYFHVASNRKAMELIHLTPFVEENIRCYGYYHCVNRYCDTRWESDASYAFEYQVCERCLTRVYPYQQDRLPDDYVPIQLTEPSLDEMLSDPDEPLPGTSTLKSDETSTAAVNDVPSSNALQSQETENGHEKSVEESVATLAKSSGHVESLPHAIAAGSETAEEPPIQENHDITPAILKEEQTENRPQSKEIVDVPSMDSPSSTEESLEANNNELDVKTRLQHEDAPIRMRKPLAFSWSRSRDEDNGGERLQTILEESNTGSDEESPPISPDRPQQAESQSLHVMTSNNSIDHELLANSFSFDETGNQRITRSVLPLNGMHRPIDDDQPQEISQSQQLQQQSSERSGSAKNHATSPQTVLEVNSDEINRMIAMNVKKDFQADPTREGNMGIVRARSYSNEVDVDRIFPSNDPSSTRDGRGQGVGERNDGGMSKGDDSGFYHEAAMPSIIGHSDYHPSLMNNATTNGNSNLNHMNNNNSIYVLGNPLVNQRRSSIVTKTSLPHSVDPSLSAVSTDEGDMEELCTIMSDDASVGMMSNASSFANKNRTAESNCQ